MDFKSLFIKKNNNQELLKNNEDVKQVTSKNNWYADRYSAILIQRNILFIFLVISMGLVVIAVFQVSNISSLYTVKPFVIEIDETSGITNVVNPLANKDLTSNNSLNQYFIMKYIMARESYCDTNYKYNYLTVVRLLSNSGVYNNFRNFVNYDPKSPLLTYGTSVCTSIKLRSIQFFEENKPNSDQIKKTAIVRFTIVDANGGKNIKYYKIVSLEYNYTQMELDIEDRIVNPLGFQVLNYKVDPEIITNE